MSEIESPLSRPGDASLPTRTVGGEQVLSRGLGLLVFISGASSLMYEVVWVRAAGLHFGTSTAAVTTVVAAFMLGLALGYRWFGTRADRSADPIALYRWLELGIGLTGLAVSLVLLKGHSWLSVLSNAVAASGSVAAPLRFVLVFLLLAIPATLMGGTLPTVARALVRAEVPGRQIGVLYAVNTAGAVLGTLIPDLLTVPRIGLWATCGMAALGNLAVAGLAGRLPRAVTPPLAMPRGSAPPLGRALFLFGVSGFVAMGYEVLWARMLGHWMGGQVTSFAILLATYLVFLALGSHLAARWADRVTQPLEVAGGVTAWVGASGLLAIALVGILPRALQPLLDPIIGAYARPPYFFGCLNALLFSLNLVAVPSLLMGAALPFLAAGAARPGSVGRATGTLYAVNTFAGVLGAVATGFFLLPRLGGQRAMVALSLAVAGAGVVVTFSGARNRARKRVQLAPAAALAIVATVAMLLPAHHLRRHYYANLTGPLDVVIEGPTTTAAVSTSLWAGEVAFRELRTPGVEMANTSASSRRYMGLMGHLPLLFSAGRKDAALVCFGVGNTARALLASSSLQRLDVVDISSEVLALSPHFGETLGGNPLADARVRVVVEDGRHFLGTTHRRYDVITSEPPPPGEAGVVNLYSREYYEVAKRALEPGGVLAQWLPVFQLSAQETRSLVAAFTVEFPHTALFHGYGYQWILLGSNAPLSIDVADWEAQMRRSGMAQDLASIGVMNLADLMAAFMLDDAGLRRVAKNALPLVDDLPTVEYSLEGLRGLDLPPGMDGKPQGVLALVKDPAGLAKNAPLVTQLRAAFGAAAIVRATLPLLWIAGPEERELSVAVPLAHALALQPGHPAILEVLRVGHDRYEPSLRAIGHGRNAPQARFTLARRHFYLREWQQALSELERVQPEAVGPRLYWLLRAGAERGAGLPEAAARSFRKAAKGASAAFARMMNELAAKADRPVLPEESPLQ